MGNNTNKERTQHYDIDCYLRIDLVTCMKPINMKIRLCYRFLTLMISSYLMMSGLAAGQPIKFACSAVASGWKPMTDRSTCDSRGYIQGAGSAEAESRHRLTGMFIDGSPKGNARLNMGGYDCEMEFRTANVVGETIQCGYAVNSTRPIVPFVKLTSVKGFIVQSDTSLTINASDEVLVELLDMSAYIGKTFMKVAGAGTTKIQRHMRRGEFLLEDLVIENADLKLTKYETDNNPTGTPRVSKIGGTVAIGKDLRLRPDSSNLPERKIRIEYQDGSWLFGKHIDTADGGGYSIYEDSRGAIFDSTVAQCASYKPNEFRRDPRSFYDPWRKSPVNGCGRFRSRSGEDVTGIWREGAVTPIRQ